MELTITPMRIGHLENVLDMWQELLGLTSRFNPLYQLAPRAVDHQRQFFQKNRTNPNTFCLVAEQDNRPVGFANGYVIMPTEIFKQTPIGLIENLFVDPEIRRCGVGSALVESCYDWFRKRMISHIYVNVVPANESSERFWQSMGYGPHKITLAKTLE